MDQGDEELLSLLATDLDGQFRQLVEVYQQRLYLFALRLVGRPDDAEDMVQEAFIRAYYALKGTPTRKVRILNLLKWLYTITLNVFRNSTRKREQHVISLDLPENCAALDLADQALGPDEEAYWREWRQELEAHIASLLSHLGLAGRPMAKRDQAVAALQDEKSPVRVAAVRSLGERREASSLPLLVSALHDPAWEVRAAALWALGAFGEYAPVEALLEALADEDGSVRAAALRVLSTMRGQVPPESLTRLLHDADQQVREAAALTVEELGEQAPPGLSVARLGDENEAQGEAAQIPPEPSPPEVLPLAFPSLPLTVQRAMQLEVLGGRYQLQGSIGRGGMATIYRGRDRRMDRVVAIKVLRELYNTEPKFVKRFEREAKAASALHHPNIVQVFDYGQTDGNYYLVMELVEGTDLRRYLRSRGSVSISRSPTCRP